MRAVIWRTPFGIALLIHMIILALLGYAMHTAAKKEIQYIEVTMEELFAIPDNEPPGGGQQAQDNMPPMPQQTVAAPALENIVQPVPPAENAANDVPALALANTGHVGTGTGGGGTGQGTGGSGGGSGTGHGTGHGGGSKRQVPSVVSSVRPDYPAVARENGWEGTVKVLVVISAGGRVEEASVVSSSGYQVLDDAAVRGLYRWRFRPGLDESGRPVTMGVTVPVRFNLKDAN